MWFLWRSIIASNLGGVKDQVFNGVNGLLFTNKDYYSLAKKIISMLSNVELRNNYGKQGSNILRELFNHNEFSIKLQNIYKLT